MSNEKTAGQGWIVIGKYLGCNAIWGIFIHREDAEKIAAQCDGVIISEDDWDRMAEEERKNAEAEQDGSDPESDYGIRGY